MECIEGLDRYGGEGGDMDPAIASVYGAGRI
jgi:hypothetical protein